MIKDTGQVVQNNDHEPTHYARIPKMAMMDLDPYELTLYAHYKMTASDSGACWKSNKTLATETGMSQRKLQDTRDALVAKGFITVTHTPDETGNINTPPVITIVNVWSQNHARYAKKEPLPLASGAKGVARHARGVASGATKEEPLKKNSEEPISAPNGTDAAPPNGKAKTPRPPHKNAPWHDALVLAFNVTPDSLTKSADRTYWNAAAELAAVQFPVESISELYRWCRGQGWKSFTVMALAKYAPTWLAERVNKPAPVATRYEYPTQAEIDTLTSPYGAAKFDADGRWIGETQEADYDGTRAAS